MVNWCRCHIFFVVWKKISMNFVTEFSFNKYQNKVYDSCLMIMNRYIKMILYIFVTKNINTMKFIEIIDKKINLQFDNSKKNCFKSKIRFYKFVLSKNMLLFENETSIKYRVLFLNKRINKTLKSNVRTLSANFLHRKLNKLNKFVNYNTIYVQFKNT